MTCPTVQDAATPTRIGNWTQGILALVGLVLACLVAHWLGTLSRPTNLNDKLVVAPDHLAFGEVWEDSEFPWTLPIENRTNRDIHIVGFASSCNCVAIEPGSLVVPAHQTVRVGLSLNLAARPKRQGESSLDEFRVHVIPRTNDDPQRHAGWIVQGRVRSVISLTSWRVRLGDGFVRARRPGKTIADIVGHVPLKTVEAQCDPPFATVRVSPRGGEGRRFLMEIEFLPWLLPGPYKSQVRLKPVSADGEPFPAVSFPVSGNVPEDVQAIPSSVAFGAHPVGTVAEETVVLRSESGKSFTVESMDFGSPEVDAEPTREATATSRTFRLVQRVTKVGLHAYTLRFNLRSVDGELLTVAVEVSYQGEPQ